MSHCRILAIRHEVAKLTPEEVATVLESNDVLLIDVRDAPQIREQGSIEGHVNIPFRDLERRLAEIPKTKQIITACNRGGSAGRAAKFLQEHGFSVVGSAGIEEWKDHGKPVVYPGKR